LSSCEINLLPAEGVLAAIRCPIARADRSWAAGSGISMVDLGARELYLARGCCCGWTYEAGARKESCACACDCLPTVSRLLCCGAIEPIARLVNSVIDLATELTASRELNDDSGPRTDLLLFTSLVIGLLADFGDILLAWARFRSEILLPLNARYLRDELMGEVVIF